jgi:hypothetical protein
LTILTTRILGGVVLALALIGALFMGSTLYRLGHVLALLDADDLRFLHQARLNVEQQQARPPAPKPAETP